MDLRQYYNDLRAKESELEKVAKAQDGVVYVTSVFHREKNSTAGATLGASPRNAARVITDGTHRDATEDEVRAFYIRQQEQLSATTKMEQMKKKQYIVVVDRNEPSESAMLGGLPTSFAKNVAKATPAEKEK